MKKMLCRFFLGSVLAVIAFVTAPGYAGELTLAVANSTCDAVKKAGDLYSRGRDVRFNYICKSSGLIAKGLRGGAISADVFISADREWMDYMIEHGLVSTKRVTSPWGNILQVAVPLNSPLRFNEWNDLVSDRVKTILIGDPGTAPFGRYTKQALERTGLWERIRPKIATKKNITLLAEALEKADADTVGILFKSNLTGRLRAVHTVDRKWHEPIRYYMAPVGNAAENAQVTDLLAFLLSPAVQEIFKAEKFDITAP